MDQDRIRLTVGSEPAHAHIAQVAASSVATRLRWKAPAINDLRLAVDEATIMLVGPKPNKGTLDIELAVDGRTLLIEVKATGQKKPVPAERVERFHAIVDPLVDEAELHPTAHTVTLRKTA